MSNYSNCDGCNNYQITINWIRHGESCANLEQKNYKDRPTEDSPIEDHPIEDHPIDEWVSVNSEEEKKTSGEEKNFFERVVDTARDAISSLAEKSTQIQAAFLYEPNLSFIGMNHAINLGTNFIYFNNKPQNIYISSPLTRTITTALLSLRFIPNAIIYVVPYINEIPNAASTIGYDYQNTAVPSQLLKKRIKFIKEWINKFWIVKFDDIEIMNFLDNIMQITTNDKLKTSINNILINRKNPDYNPYAMQTLINDLIVDKDNILQSLSVDGNNDIYNKIIQTYSTLKEYQNKFNKFKKGPIVNFEIYEYYENLKKNPIYKNILPDLEHPNIDFFYTNVLKTILQDIKFNRETNSYPLNLTHANIEQPNYSNVEIYAFAHGSLIRNIWKKFNAGTYKNNEHELHEMMNTAVIEDKVILCEYTHIVVEHNFFIKYNPEKLRINVKYREMEENQKENICDNGSVKGVINNIGEIMEKTKSETSKFYNRHVVKFNDSNLPSQFAGAGAGVGSGAGAGAGVKARTTDTSKSASNYKNKYLKYKSKYTHLKNNS